MKKYVVLVAGGSGSRMKSAVPKQFLLLKGKPVLMHTIQQFYSWDTALEIIVVLPENQLDEWQILCSLHAFHINHQIVAGGPTRFHSVKNGLHVIKEAGLVGIHDGVRPLVNHTVLTEVYKSASILGNAVPSVPLNDSIRELSGTHSEARKRENYRLVQTPQCFHTNLIQKAYTVDYREEFTDCASVAEADGNKINLVDGNFENIKITTPSDILIAEALM